MPIRRRLSSRPAPASRVRAGAWRRKLRPPDPVTLLVENGSRRGTVAATRKPVIAAVAGSRSAAAAVRDELRPDRPGRTPRLPQINSGDAGAGGTQLRGQSMGAGDGPDPDRLDDHGPRGRGRASQPRRAGGPDPGRGAGARRRRPGAHCRPRGEGGGAPAEELPLGDGLRHERRAFFALFATEDQTEGMAAFVEKRRPEWKGR